MAEDLERGEAANAELVARGLLGGAVHLHQRDRRIVVLQLRRRLLVLRG